MNLPRPLKSSRLESRVFLLLLVAVTLAFGWILVPFFGAVFWGVVMAILFAPLYRKLVPRLKGRRTSAALLTMAVILVIVILPLGLITGALVREGAAVYERIQNGELNFANYFAQVYAVLPHWLTSLLDRAGLGNLAELQEKLTASLRQISQFVATQALAIGQNTLDVVISFFIMLYLMFFLLRDGAGLSRRIRDAVPLNDAHKRELSAKFATVVRATVKGNVLVAVAQGALGGIAFAFLGIHAALLWAVLMAFLSLLPAVGAGLIWAPVAVYFLVTGAVWKGVVLISYGVLVIGLVDNVLRPVLVGKDTKMPDYVVLISTLGGMAIFGLNGFVIGPVIAAMFMAVWDLFVVERAEFPDQIEHIVVSHPAERRDPPPPNDPA
jgi:predicted PurR-regulated permease PerM